MVSSNHELGISFIVILMAAFVLIVVIHEIFGHWHVKHRLVLDIVTIGVVSIAVWYMINKTLGG